MCNNPGSLSTERVSRAIADLFDVGIRDGRVLVIRCTHQLQELGLLLLEAQVLLWLCNGDRYDRWLCRTQLNLIDPSLTQALTGAHQSLSYLPET